MEIPAITANPMVAMTRLISMTSPPKSPWIFCSALLCVQLVGCGKDDRAFQTTAQVAVQVFHRGTPVADCQVILHPCFEPPAGKRRVIPNGRTDARGNALLNSYTINDGAPPGDYVVTLTCEAEFVRESDDEVLRGPDRFGGRYANPQESPLSVTVSKDGTEPIRIDLE